MTNKELAATLGHHPSYVSKLRQVIEGLAPAIMEAWGQGDPRATVTLIFDLARRPRAEQLDLWAKQKSAKSLSSYTLARLTSGKLVGLPRYARQYAVELRRAYRRLHPTIQAAWANGEPRAVPSTLMELAKEDSQEVQLALWKRGYTLCAGHCDSCGSLHFRKRGVGNLLRMPGSMLTSVKVRTTPRSPYSQHFPEEDSFVARFERWQNTEGIRPAATTLSSDGCYVAYYRKEDTAKVKTWFRQVDAIGEWSE